MQNKVSIALYDTKSIYFFYGTKVILEFQLFNKLFCRIAIKKKFLNVVKQGNHSTVEKIIIFSGKI